MKYSLLLDQQKAMDLVTCCVVLCSVDSTFTNVCILFGVFIFVTKMFIKVHTYTADNSKQCL